MDFSRSTTHHHTTKSLQNLLLYPAVVHFHTYTLHGRSKSLPNIFIISSFASELFSDPPKSFNNPESLLLVKKQSTKPKILKKTWDKVKTVIHNTTSSQSNRRGSLRNKGDSNKASGSRSSYCASSAPSTPIQKTTFDFEGNAVSPMTNYISSSEAETAARCSMSSYNETSPEAGADRENTVGIEESETIQRNYAKLQKRLSEELHQRMSEYKPDPNRHSTDNLSDDFKKRLQQWEMWKLSTGKVTYTEEELQQILPEDFSRKLHEWECIKTSGVSPHHQQGQGGSGQSSVAGGRHHSKTPDSYLGGVSPSTFGTSSPEVPIGKSKLLRKKKNTESSRQKELAWLEKQLEKIEAEKKRLEREMKKYNEREARLEKMKEALQNTNANELWIRTPTAKCKVEKITEKFTKKLYEWEEKQGIQPESSTMALLHPKYFGPPPGENDEDFRESCSNASSSRPVTESEEFIERMENTLERFGEKEEICCPQNALQNPFENDGDFGNCHQQSHSDECVFQIPQEQMMQNLQMQGEEMRQVSSASSSDFEEATTDSFATHDKGNSGASNTDSDFYRAEFPGSRRRSSEAISTPLSARSPSLSAFTSDDEGEMYGLLKTVCEEESETLNNTLKDAESQTEVILKAKPIHVLDDEEDMNADLSGDETTSALQTGADIFVQTKRTIFTPILADEMETEKVVLIEQDLRSPSLVKSLICQSQTESGAPDGPFTSSDETRNPQVFPSCSTLHYERSDKEITSPVKIIGSCPPQNNDEEENAPHHPSSSSTTSTSFPYSSSSVPGRVMYYGMNSPLNLQEEEKCRTPPRIVEVIPKMHHSSNTTNTMPQYPDDHGRTSQSPHQLQGSQYQSNSPQRTFPKMGKVPIWCSPLGSRKYLGGSSGFSSTDGNNIIGGSISSEFQTTAYCRSHSTSIDFTNDSRYLTDSEDPNNDPGANANSSSSRCICTSASTSRIPSVTPRLYRRNTSAAVIEESGLVGANVQTGQRHPAILLPARSSSFRFRREPSDLELRSSLFRGTRHIITTPSGQVSGSNLSSAAIEGTSTVTTSSISSSTNKGLYTQLRNRVGSVVTKSQSTGSIKSKLGKAFSSLTHKITGDRDHHHHHHANPTANAAAATSGPSSQLSQPLKVELPSNSNVIVSGNTNNNPMPTRIPTSSTTPQPNTAVNNSGNQETNQTTTALTAQEQMSPTMTSTSKRNNAIWPLSSTSTNVKHK